MQSEVKTIRDGCVVEKFDMPELNGFQLIYRFDNGYGASLIRHDMSYGGDEGLYEIAVLDSSGELCYDTPITDDVVGHLTMVDADIILAEIAEL